MKKVFSVLFCALIFVNLLVCASSAEEPKDILLSRTTEVLDSGDYIVTELYQSAIQPYTGTTGYKTSTYYNGSNKAMWAITVKGTFTYTYGVSSQATSAESIVEIYDSGCVFKSKNAYYYDNIAIATGTVQYMHSTTSKSVSVSCSIYGTLS